MPIRKAVVPAAGLGTRHFPASHAVKKELFPVVGPDGIARALMHYHLLDLLAAGLEEVCLIVQPGDEEAFRRYFAGPTPDYLARLAKYPELHAEAVSMQEISARIRYVTQPTQDGYGHAVFQSRDFAAGEPVLLCLGDHLFRGGSDQLPRPTPRRLRATSRQSPSPPSAASPPPNSVATAPSRVAALPKTPTSSKSPASSKNPPLTLPVLTSASTISPTTASSVGSACTFSCRRSTTSSPK